MYLFLHRIRWNRGWTNIYMKGEIDADNKITPCGKGMCLLWQDPDSEEIRRTIRKLQGVSSADTLRLELLQIEQNNQITKQGNSPEKGKSNTNDKVQPMPCDNNPATPPPRYCQLRRCGSSMPEMPRTITYCKWHLGKNEKKGSLRVDELRLLGNGVVPQCAAIAFVELMKKFNS